jgi:SAM-dependent methyltransferase
VHSVNPETVKLESELDKLLPPNDVRVLDAGCGAKFPFRLPRHARITGVDVSEAGLAQNPALDEKIVGDIQTYRFPPNQFDLVVCWNVLEHVPRPEQAIANLASSLKDGGVIVLGMPNVLSLKGLLTKFTPHRFHVWVYRTIFRKELAGTEGHFPFRTFLRFSMSPNAIRRLARANGLSVRYVDLFEAPMQRTLRRRSRVVDLAWRASKLPIKVLSLGKVDAERSNCIIVLEKPLRAPRGQPLTTKA